jgi:tetratricopeptide (TPR) repeat protein
VTLQFVKARATQALWSEMNHIRGSFDWAAAQSDDPNRQRAITLATASTMVLAVSGFTHEALTRLLAVKLWVNAKTPSAIAARYWQWLGRSGVHGLLATSRCIEAFIKAEKLFQAMNDWRHVHACRRMRAEALLDNQQLTEAKQALLEAQTMETPDWPVADRLRRLKIQALLSSQLGEHTTALRLAEQALSMAEMAGIERYVLAIQLDIADLHLKAGALEEALTRYSHIVSQSIRQHYHRFTVSQGYVGFMTALVHNGDLAQAAMVCQQGLPHWRSSGIVLKNGDIFAWWLAQVKQPLMAAQMLTAADAFFIRREVVRSAIEEQTRAAAMSALNKQVTASQLRGWLEIDPTTPLEESRLLEELATQLERFLATH